MPSLSVPHLSCTTIFSLWTRSFLSAVHHAHYCSIKKKNLPLSTPSTSTLSFSFMIKPIKCSLSLFSQLLLASQPNWLPSGAIVSDISVVFATLLLETLFLKYFHFHTLLFLLLSVILADSSSSVKCWHSQGKAPGPLDVSLYICGSQILAHIRITGGFVNIKLQDPILRVSDLVGQG